MERWFASDNNSGVHPEVMQALAEANAGHCVAYGSTVLSSPQGGAMVPPVAEPVVEPVVEPVAELGPAPMTDPYTARAADLFRLHFGEDIAVYFVYNGTAANVLGLRAVMDSWQALPRACHRAGAHVNVHECGAPETFSGTKLLLVPSPDGKITPEGINRHLVGIGDEHCVQPRVVSITQATEYGTVYLSG